MTALLDVRGMTVAYGNVTAVRDVNLSVAAGSVVALLGPNGAGKSSILQAVAGLAPVRSGSVHFDGEPITGMEAHRVARRSLRLVPEGRALFPELTVDENLQVGAGGRTKSEDYLASRQRVFETFPVLADRPAQRAGTLSGGEQQMLAIARALISNPRMVLLDEPSMGLAPRIVSDIMRVLSRLRETGFTVLLAEQNARAVLPHVDEALVLVAGTIVARGDPEEIEPLVESGYISDAVTSTDASTPSPPAVDL